MKIYKLINFFDKYFGYLFFKNYNSFRYNLLDLFLKKKLSKRINNNFIKKFLDDGYFILDYNFSDFSEKLSSLINLQDKNINKVNYYKFEINEDIKKLIKKFINNDLSDYLNKLKEYFNSNVYVTNITLKRNFYSPIADKEEVYNNFYHNDAYVYNHFKLFINLMDIDVNTGPTHIFSTSDTRKIINMVRKYKRNNQIEKLDAEIIPYKHVGPSGKSLFCFTSKCLHKAGVPSKNKFRDYLIITFVAYPNKENDNCFYYEENFENEIWNGDTNKLTTNLAKPYNLKKMLTLYKKFI